MTKIQEFRSRLKVLREQKQVLVSELRAKRALKQGVDVEMSKIRADIKREKSKKNEAVSGQADQTATQQTE